MDTDITFVAGLLMVAFAIPMAVSAYSDGERLTLPGLVALLGASGMFYAVMYDPMAYQPHLVDDVIVDVFGRLLNA